MKKFVLKRDLLPTSIKRFSDISAEPLFACKKRKSNIFPYFFEINEYICKKWDKSKTIKCLLTALPFVIIFILTGGICASVNEKIGVLTPQSRDIKKSFLQNEIITENYLLVVNQKSPIAKNYKPDLTHYMQIDCDRKLVKSLDELLTAAKKLNFNLQVTKGFVTEDLVEKNYKEKLNQLLNENLSAVRAESLAEKMVSSPGKSEYQTGLLVDISIPTKSRSEFISSDEYKWLINNCVNFGFIPRYPEDKADKTGKDFNPYAFRFVGENNARKMRSLSMCLEEYIQYIKTNN